MLTMLTGFDCRLCVIFLLSVEVQGTNQIELIIVHISLAFMYFTYPHYFILTAFYSGTMRILFDHGLGKLSKFSIS